MTEYKEVRVHDVSPQNRRLSYLAYLLNAEDACTAVAFFKGKFYVSNNFGNKGFVKQVMRFLKDFQVIPYDRVWIERRKEELLKMTVKRRISRYKTINKYSEKKDTLKALKLSLPADLSSLEEKGFIFGSNQSLQDKIQTIIALETNIIEELERMNSQLDEIKREKMRIQSLIKESPDQTRKEQLKAERTGFIELEGLLRVSRDQSREKSAIVQKYKVYQSQFDGFERLKTTCKEIKETIKRKLKDCMRKVLLSLQRQYPPERSFKNFDEDMTKLHYRFANFWCQTRPKLGKPHAEMKVVNKILPLMNNITLENARGLEELENQIFLKELHRDPEALRSRRVLRLKERSAEQILQKSSLYIGISYLCCGDCYEIFEEIYLSNNFNQILFHSQGTHRILYENWMMPPNIHGLQSKSDKLNVKGDGCRKDYVRKTNNNEKDFPISLNSIQSIEDDL